MPRVAVIGAGIAGLSAALRLALTPDVDVVLIERDERLGGKILTDHAEGCVLEGGPDGFIAWKPQARALCESLGLDVVQSAAGRSGIVAGGRVHPIPAGIAGAIPTQIMPTLTSPLLSVAGKARLLAEPLVPRRRTDSDESVGSFVRRRGGREVWDRLVEPLVTGMYAGDGEALSVEATLPMLPDAERTYGGLVRAGRAARRSSRPTGGPPTFLTPSGGMGAIVAAIRERIADTVDIRCGTRVWGLIPADAGWTVAAGDAVLAIDGVVLATPASTASRLVAAFDPELSGVLDDIPYGSSAVVSMVFPAGVVPASIGHGYLVPRAERTPVVACSVASAKFPQLAAADRSVIRMFMGRHGDADVVKEHDDELVRRARGELRRTMGIDVAPTAERVVRWDEAIPQYVIGHRARIERIRARVDLHPGLELAGAAYRGVGIADCIASGDDAAGRVLRHIRGDGPSARS